MKRVGVLAFACLLLVGMTAGAGAGAKQGFKSLDPGGPADFHEEVPVNFVFLGYNRKMVHEGKFLDGLPSSYRSIVQSRLWYGIKDFLGVDFTYDYTTRYTGKSYENRFFNRLSSLAEPAALTEYQALYNDQKKNVLNVKDNHFIDAPSVERWLAEHPPSGIDTAENTIFFVNWYGRDDFVHHVYTKTDEPDPDTGFNFGVERDSRKIIAWGGTTADDEENGLGDVNRLWFYDLSAGPESLTSNWNVDDRDLPGIDVNNKPEYRMPPIWEYRRNGYRNRSALSKDLSLVARYVGIDLLFTTSPLYPPDITPPDLPTSINVDANTYEGWPGVDASSGYITPSLLVDELGELQPLNSYSYDNEDLAFTEGEGARRCYLLWRRDVECLPRRPYPAFANLFLYNALRLDETRDGAGDYESGVFNYSTIDRLAPPLLGYADDNYRDGTQSLVYSFVSPDIVEAGYGLTITMIHEVGHHVGMSHPHSGFDWESRTAFGPADRYYFAWSGAESNTVMSYIDLNWDFSQFDRDNMNRYMAAAYVENANAIAAEILADPDAETSADELAIADTQIAESQSALAGHDYPAAARHAKVAYEAVRVGGRQAGVPVVGSQVGTHVDPPVDGVQRNRHGYAFIDRLGKDSPRAQP